MPRLEGVAGQRREARGLNAGIAGPRAQTFGGDFLGDAFAFATRDDLDRLGGDMRTARVGRLLTTTADPAAPPAAPPAPAFVAVALFLAGAVRLAALRRLGRFFRFASGG